MPEPSPDDPRVLSPSLLLLCAAALMTVRHLNARGIEVGMIGKILCVIPVTLMIFTV